VFGGPAPLALPGANVVATNGAPGGAGGRSDPGPDECLVYPAHDYQNRRVSPTACKAEPL